MAARLVCPPPFVNFTSTRISPATALSRIQAYLEESKLKEYLHPDCLFDDEGPHANKAGGITLHQLRRVEKGLQGIELQPEPEVDPESALDLVEEEHGTARPTNDGHSAGVEASQEVGVSDDSRLDHIIAARRAKAQIAEDAGEDVDMINGEVTESYQQQLFDQGEGVLEGEIDNRNPAAPTAQTDSMVNGRPEPVMATDSPSKKRRYDEVASAGHGADKEARKRAKKEKAKEEQRLRAQERSKPKTLENDPSQQSMSGSASSPATTKKSGGILSESGEKPNVKEESESIAPPSARKSILKPSRAAEKDSSEANVKRKRSRKADVAEHEQSALDMPLNTPARTNGRISKSINDYDKDKVNGKRQARRREEREAKSVKFEQKQKRVDGHSDDDEV